MDSIQFTNFSDNGVIVSDTFETWRQKTNGIISEVADIRSDISPLFFADGNSRSVTLDTPQTITGAKTFSAGSAGTQTIKIGGSGLYESASTLISTSPLQSTKLIATTTLQLGAHNYVVPPTSPTERSLLNKSGAALEWRSYADLVAEIKSEGAVNVSTTNVVLPVGSIVSFAAVIAPSGWLPCNGASFSAVDYPALAALLPSLTLPNISGSIIKALPDRVVNTIINRGNVFSIVKDDTSVASLSLTDGGTGTLNLNIDNTLQIDGDRRLGVADLPISGTKIIDYSLSPEKLSEGAPVWTAGGELYEGEATPENRVASRKYVDDRIFRIGNVSRLLEKPSSARHTSAPVSGNFGYINDDGVPVITGVNNNNRFGGDIGGKYNTEMPLPENRRAVKLFVSYRQTAALDETGELWVIGLNHHNMFNMSPWNSLPKEWTKAYNPLYSYSTGNKIKKVIMSGSLDIVAFAVIDTSDRLWVSGHNGYGTLGRGDVTNTDARLNNIEATPVLTGVLDAMLVGSYTGSSGGTFVYETCIALTESGLRIAGYGGIGLSGDGLARATNSTFNTVTLPGVTDYSACELYGFGEDSNAAAFVLDKTTNIIYGWGYGANGIFGDNSATNKSSPAIIWNNPNDIVDKVYSTHHVSPSAYILVNRKRDITQIGAQQIGTVANERLGTAVAINTIGTTFAAGAPATGNGKVNIYSVNTSGTIGSPVALTGPALNSQFGASLSFNSSGNILAVGVPNMSTGSNVHGRVVVYQNVGGTWSQRGANIEKTTETGARAGTSVALSGDGTVLVVGSPNFSTNLGKVTTWSWNGSAWVEFGNAIVGSAASSFIGKRVAINSTGTRLAFSSDLSNGTVFVYELIGGAWTQVGLSIAGLASGDANGSAIALNAIGDILAIGAPGNDTAGSNFGQTRIFKLNAARQWVQFGNSINGKSTNDASGTSVALSTDGNTVVIGAPLASSEGLATNGRAIVYKYIDNTWKLVASDINGKSVDEQSGSSIAVSGDCSRVLIGSPKYTSSSVSSRGAVNLYRFDITPSDESTTELWCSGNNDSNKFGIAGAANTWRRAGSLPSGYRISDFWCGNGLESGTTNFIKAYRESDGKFYLFAAGLNLNYSAGTGQSGALSSWTRVNLQSKIIEKVVDVQTVVSYSSASYGGYTVLHLDDGTLYFAGYNSYAIDSSFPVNLNRTDFTRIK
jgi:hypothetical protein